MREKEIFEHIKTLTEDEQALYTKTSLTDEERKKLHDLEVELDQYWDLLRQRRALKSAGRNPEKANLRGPDTVENYEQ